MKIFNLIIFAGLILLSSFSNSKKNPVNNEEVIVAITNMEQNDLKLIKEKISLFPGVAYKGFCEDQRIIALLVDRSIVPDNKAITDALLSVKEDFKLFYKEGSFADLQNICIDKEKLFTR